MNKHILSEILTYVALYIGVAVVMYGFLYTAMEGYGWLVPMVALIVVPPTVWATYRSQRRKQHAVARAYVVKVHRETFRNG